METVLVAGANGNTGRRIISRLLKQSDYKPLAMIRKESQKSFFDEMGCQTIVADLEGDLKEAVRQADRIIFAAGSGSKTPPEKTIDVDQNGAINLMGEAQIAGIKKFVILSSMGTEPPYTVPAMEHYFKAKKAADDHLKTSGLEFSIVRPGQLTNEPGTGKIKAAKNLNNHGKTSRDNLADVLTACLTQDVIQNKIVEILDGDTAIETALASVQ